MVTSPTKITNPSSKSTSFIFFLSSHILVEIEKVAGCIAIINNGKLLFQGMTEEIKKKGGLSSVYQEVLIGQEL